MAGSERAVIYVDSGSDFTGLSKVRNSVPASNAISKEHHIMPNLQDKNNYVIKIQIGEESMYNPVRIDVSSAKNGNREALNKSSILDEDSPLNSSGQSSPRSDMTPPPRINTGSIRFGSETSESDTESDVSAEYRPITCPTAQFAMREMLDIEPLRAVTKPMLHKSISSYAPLPRQESPLKTHLKELHSLASPVNNHPPLHNSLSLCQKSLITSSGNGTTKIASPIEFLNDRLASLNITPPTKKGGRQARPNRFSGNAAHPQESSEMTVIDENGFHLNETSDLNSKVVTEASESLSNFAGYRDIFARAKQDGSCQIMSEKGTIRGVKNRVRDGIATFLQSTDVKTFSDKEQGRVVVYVTSMGVVRDTFQRCQKVKQILRTLLVKFDERDCYMNRSIQDEIRQRLPSRFNMKISANVNNGSSNSTQLSSAEACNKNLTSGFNNIPLPQVFLEGQYLGDAEKIEKLNETGELRDLLRPYKSLSVLTTCDRCGGFRMLPCPICNGSKKSVHRNHFTTEFVALKCMHCDPSGLVNCDLCNSNVAV
ncbi:unnamed protein product [Allacma fusca]|uniref:Glutaredoxin domain-containing protein n=1 Tax=Allacma fusca TaxID=39272 RepID=A0A8J2KW01_9HEXA|nr:unnamed protein product [Allacma fusca]